ncbi:nucleotidyltransferase [Amycolatopsis nivea]|uniref:nucleotidyltransferase n=1 Tax=Amycolatopsis nivea TaxID=1644109 RepID=UPI00106F8590|nr:nucleotidyltransferase [Amycolatopsis nivea]
MTSTPDQFEEMLARITLTTTQATRIESAVSGLKSYLASTFSLDDDEVFLQGSYANGTAIKPRPGGEYDVDIVACTGVSNQTTNDALNSMAERLRDNGTYRNRVEPKERCVRLRYADEGSIKFHVDVVPVRLTYPNYLEAPKRSGDWSQTTPQEFAEWCETRGERFQNLVKIIKRWRDEQQEVRAAIKSITLQVLVSKCMSTASDQAQLVVDTFRAMHEYLMRPGIPAIYNPTLPSENLSSRWTLYNCDRFRKQVEAALDTAERALAEPDPDKSQLLWKEVFKTAYPDSPMTNKVDALNKRAASVAKGHSERPRDRGWTESLNRDYQVNITADVYNNDRKTLLSVNIQNDHMGLATGWFIRFEANVTSSDDAKVWWKVVNTGEEAEEAKDFRGHFFKAEDRSDNDSPLVNWERLKYRGRHWIECYIVKRSTIVARSGLFYVNVI